MKLNSQAGFITADFLFSMVLILGFSGLMFVLTFTLSMASVTQYITFAAARNYVTGHIDRTSQEERGKLKYAELVGHPVFKPLYSNGWFKVDKEPNIGDHTKIIPEFETAAQVANKSWVATTTRCLAPNFFCNSVLFC